MISNQLKALLAISIGNTGGGTPDPCSQALYNHEPYSAADQSERLAAHYREERLRRKAENFKKRQPKKDKS